MSIKTSSELRNDPGFRNHQYLGRVLRTLPKDGRVVVHNHIRPPVPEDGRYPKEHWGRDKIGLGYMAVAGESGFRLWIQDNSDKLCSCDCGCPAVPHYRVIGASGDPGESQKGELYEKGD
jgi:hypothetical protein